MDTNSSGSVRESRYYLQMAGAEARERLLLAAATMWKVPTSELVAKNSVITHTPSGRRTTYGAVAAQGRADRRCPIRRKIKIKGPDQFTLIGTEQKNLDVPLKVTGKAVYGIDVDLPGMLYAAAKACPVFGGTVKSYDFNAIKDRPGVHSVVTIEGKAREMPTSERAARNIVRRGRGRCRHLVAGQDRARPHADRMGRRRKRPSQHRRNVRRPTSRP